jgi:hypothetical protein
MAGGGSSSWVPTTTKKIMFDGHVFRATLYYITARILYRREEGGDEHCTGVSSENEDGHAAWSREDQRDMREMSETPDEDRARRPGE